VHTCARLKECAHAWAKMRISLVRLTTTHHYNTRIRSLRAQKDGTLKVCNHSDWWAGCLIKTALRPMLYTSLSMCVARKKTFSLSKTSISCGFFGIGGSVGQK